MFPLSARSPALGAVLLVSLATTALAQPVDPGPAGIWELSFHAGGLISTSPSGGTLTLPAGNSSVSLATGGTGRRISSWFFGEGAQLMNDVNSRLGVSQQITPLDAVLQAPIVQHQGKMALGFRLARGLSRRLTAEITIEYSPIGVRAADAVAGGLAATRSSFVTAMRPLIGSAAPNAFFSPFTTNSSVGHGTGGELVTIGALRVALTPVRRLTPFVVGGVGLASRSGELPAARIDGDYGTTFGFPGCVCTLREHDEIQVRVEAPARGLLGMLGAGVDFQPALRFWRGSPQNRSRWGIRVDARLHLGATKSETFIDARPSITVGPPNEDNPDYPYSGVLVVGTSPSAQFSNNPQASGFESTLTGQPLTNVRVFSGSGLRTRVALSTGVFVRF
jgi:hypothetical protein